MAACTSQPGHPVATCTECVRDHLLARGYQPLYGDRAFTAAGVQKYLDQALITVAPGPGAITVTWKAGR